MLINIYKSLSEYNDKSKVAQRILSLKKKTRLTVMNINSKLSKNLKSVS